LSTVKATVELSPSALTELTLPTLTPAMRTGDLVAMLTALLKVALTS